MHEGIIPGEEKILDKAAEVSDDLLSRAGITG
jgi:hypothetical protein